MTESQIEEVKVKLWNAALNWTEYEEESGSLILGFSLHYLLLHETLEDILD